ncbi:PEP-CTERM sorting domain-containing protein [Cylindrospermum sp. FACHB-282]|uniref:PEP-CTERM sorting domain-containing protein n=1 Tax=Cylindrospermum sp. FACHB-282 TaxID=2692794 RepID=UPI0016825C73|nr:PEP-CTERM sorting domain-containing protein [Cylindrospermum sp. FACHB-282]MBD2388224.1 PEP-CTERM sorting domain-containing protein [Cylindrospermum sp. FACHB-282]
MGTARTSAATITTINIAGTFGPNLIVELPDYPEFLIPPNLYTTFAGYYTVDPDKLPNDPYDDNQVARGEMILRDSSGVIVESFLTGDGEFMSASLQGVSFFDGGANIFFDLFVNSDLTPRQEVQYGVPSYGLLRINLDRYITRGLFNVTSIDSFNVTSVSVPEPFTLGGTAVAGVMGFWLRRRKLKASLPESNPNNI